MARSANRASLGKTPRNGKALSARSQGEAEDHGKSAKVKGRSRAPKLPEYWRCFGW